MRGVKKRIDSRRIGLSTVAAAKLHKFAQAGRTEQSEPKMGWHVESSPLGGQEAVPSKDLQNVIQKQSFVDSAQWWEYRQSKSIPQHLDCRHEKPKVSEWLNNRHKPVWVDFKDDASITNVETGSTRAQGLRDFPADDIRLDVGLCRKLCENGVLSEAVDAVGILVQRGCIIPSTMFYRILSRCIQSKDLALGRRIHALTVQSGCEGNAFLATHLISLYASHRRLEEAMAVFTSLVTPNTYNWAAIIFAYARYGVPAEAAEAIRLYRKMGECTPLKPDNRLFSAVLKACSVARDVVTGKEVHAHILAGPAKPDRFVQVGLVDMYVKCGCLEDARRLFDKLSDRNVVTWTAMIAGYARQRMGHEALSLYSRMKQEGLTANAVTYVCLLQACASLGLGGLYEGSQLHAQIKKQGLEEDAVLGGSLVNMYAKCGSLDDARRVFDKLPDRNLVAWNAMIAAYFQHGMGEEALSLHSSLKRDGQTSNSVTYGCLLQACASVGVGALEMGKEFHAQIQGQGLEEDRILGGCLVNMYAKCGSLDEARELFERLPGKNVVAWTAMIAGYTQHGMGREALSLSTRMQQDGGLTPDSVTYVCLLQACASIGTCGLVEGKKLHAQVKEEGLEHDAVLGGSLVNMYVKCGSVEDARILFNKLADRSVVAWTAMIAGYAQQGMSEEALDLYSRMQHEGLVPHSITYVCLLQACASVGASALHEGKQLHVHIEEGGVEVDAVLGGSLINMYAKCGSLENARKVFDTLSDKNIVAWNAIMAGYVQQGMGQEALCLYNSMQQHCCYPDAVTYVCLLQACAGVGVSVLDVGKQLHVQIQEQGMDEDADLIGGLVNMYAKCGSLEDARTLFDTLPDKNVVTWTSMIAGYAQHEMGWEALNLYKWMQEEGITRPNSFTYACLLQACASIGGGALDQGKRLHSEISALGLEEDVVLAVSLLHMYARCGSLEDACTLFQGLSHRDVVTWTAIIGGYVQQGMGQEALSLYGRMLQEGVSPDAVTYVCLLQACAVAVALPLGVQLHAEIERRGMLANGNVGTALVNMYAKCGSISDAQRVFDSLSERSIEAWNALVSGYAHQGDSEFVFDLLARMRVEGVHPDAITLVSVLTVCSHVGLVDKGRELFRTLLSNYGVTATLEHYICMVDLLGRAGHLHEALKMAKDTPFPPSQVLWHTLLGACQKWKNVEIGRQAFEGAVSMDSKDAGAYVLMSNIYENSRMCEAAKDIKARRREMGAWKQAGQSWWTDMEGVTHTFLAGDQKQTKSEVTKWL